MTVCEQGTLLKLHSILLPISLEVQFRKNYQTITILNFFWNSIKLVVTFRIRRSTSSNTEYDFFTVFAGLLTK